MKQRVKCPGCKIALAFDTLEHERGGICPECGQLVLPLDENGDDEAPKKPSKRDEPGITAHPERTPGAGKLESLPAVLSIESKIEDLQWESKSLAREHGARLDADWETEFVSQKAMDNRLAELKRELPEVESAYEPSGKIPASAFGAMLIGTMVATAAGVLAELLVGSVAAAVIALLAFLNVALAALGCIWCLAAILFVIVGLIAYVAPFIATGWTCAWVTTKFGRWQKNRSATVAALLSMVATGLASVIVWLPLALFSGVVMADVRPMEMGESAVFWGANGLMALGLLIAIATAGLMGVGFVKAAKFCENCEEFMDETELKLLNAGGLQGMVHALRDGKPPLAAAMLCGESGKEGKAMLFECPSCHSGFVELQLEFKGHWKQDGEKNDHEEFWLVASEPLSASDVAWFRIFKEQA